MAVRLALSAGEAHDNRLAAKLLSRLEPDRCCWLTVTMMPDWIRALAARKRAFANTPPTCNRKQPICFRPYLYRIRDWVERFFNNTDRVATRYENREQTTYLAFVQLAAIRPGCA